MRVISGLTKIRSIRKCFLASIMYSAPIEPTFLKKESLNFDDVSKLDLLYYEQQLFSLNTLY